MDEKRMRAVRAIANATRKRARILINKDLIGSLVAEIQTVHDDNRYHTDTTIPINECIEGNQIMSIMRLLTTVTNMANEGYIFADGVDYAPEYIEKHSKYINAYIEHAKNETEAPKNYAERLSMCEADIAELFAAVQELTERVLV